MSPAPDDALTGSIDTLSARSLALSALLGTHPPRLPVAALIALGELFGIAPSAMRTALSRLVAAGDAEADDGRYSLAGPLVERQGQQDRSLEPPSESDEWWTVLAVGEGRPLAERRQFRRTLSGARFGEVRPDTWLRPANLPAPDLAATEVIVTRGTLTIGEAPTLASSLWDLPAIERRAAELDEALTAAIAPGGEGELPTEAIAGAFLTSATAIRFLRAEPWLPPSLHAGTHAAQLRTTYGAAQTRLQTALRRFFAQAAPSQGSS